MTGTPLPVLVTRPSGRGGSLVALLQGRGLEVWHRPLVELVPEAGEELSSDLADLREGRFTHLVLTSRSAVDALLTLDDGATLARIPEGTRVVAVGPGTARHLEAAGCRVDLIAGGSATDLVSRMPPARGEQRVLFPASAAASPTVREGLESLGYRVRQTVAYAPRAVAPAAQTVRALQQGSLGALVLTSPMIARLAAQIGVHPRIPVVTIGEPTTIAAHDAGLEVRRQSAEATDAALADAVLEVLAVVPPSLTQSIPPAPKESL